MSSLNYEIPPRLSLRAQCNGAKQSPSLFYEIASLRTSRNDRFF